MADGGRETDALDVVVVAFRSAALLDDCLRSIAADVAPADRPSRSHVVVVDNASPDDSAKVAARHEGVDVVVSDTNLGFGGGCNLGAACGRGDYVLFLNPDARLAPGCISRLLATLVAEPSVGAVGPAVVDPAGAYRAASAGFEPSLRSIVGHFLLAARLPVAGRWFPPLQMPQGTRERRPDWVTGAALLVRRVAFEAVGGFDDSIFLYMEDVDLCRRLREVGWEIGYVPEAVVHHQLGGTQGRDQAATWITSFHAYLRRRNGTLYASIAILLAGLGLALRAAAYARSRPTLSRRLGSAAVKAVSLCLTPAFRATRGRS